GRNALEPVGRTGRRQSAGLVEKWALGGGVGLALPTSPLLSAQGRLADNSWMHPAFGPFIPGLKAQGFLAPFCKGTTTSMQQEGYRPLPLSASVMGRSGCQ